VVIIRKGERIRSRKCKGEIEGGVRKSKYVLEPIPTI
jgi:hypothetical protein